MDDFTHQVVTSQGNYCTKQEAIWEQEKFDGLIRAILKKPTWGRDFIKNMELKKGKEYAQKLKDAANKMRDKRIKGRQNTQFRR